LRSYGSHQVLFNNGDWNLDISKLIPDFQTP
jgi:hypothetical protein